MMMKTVDVKVLSNCLKIVNFAAAGVGNFLYLNWMKKVYLNCSNVVVELPYFLKVEISYQSLHFLQERDFVVVAHAVLQSYPHRNS